MENENNKQEYFTGSCVESDVDVLWEKVVSGIVDDSKLNWMEESYE